jgi:methylated-DNA-[protein]-cysteine S-methyltransferase
MNRTTSGYVIFETARGFCGIAWSGFAIIALQLPTKRADAAGRLLRRRAPGAAPGSPPLAVAEVVASVKRYFDGEESDFSAVELDLNAQEPFARQIYEAVRRVRWGHTITYGSLAKQLGAGPETAREVGQAMARNPVPLIIPCHRVLAAGNRIGGFPAPGGSAANRRMLELEGVQVEPVNADQPALPFRETGGLRRR